MLIVWPDVFYRSDFFMYSLTIQERREAPKGIRLEIWAIPLRLKFRQFTRPDRVTLQAKLDNDPVLDDPNGHNPALVTSWAPFLM